MNNSSAETTTKMKEIWSKIISVEAFGSNGCTYNEWFQLFFPFNTMREQRYFQGDNFYHLSTVLESGAFLPAYTSCPIKIEDINYTLQSGFIGIKVYNHV